MAVKVIVAEDDPKMQNMLTALLEKEGFEVIRAGGGKEALARHAEIKPEIMCLDVMMGDMSGFDVCRQVRAADARVNIIMVTSKSRDADVAEGMAAGANDYIVKPYDLVDITARLRDVARKCVSRDNPELYAESFGFGDLAVFPGQLRATRGAVNIDLNFRDVCLLRHFAQNRGAAVPAAALRKYCWEAHPSGPEKLVDWHVSQLRRKIEVDDDKPELVKSADGGYLYG